MLKDKDFTERIIPLFVIVMIAWVLVFLVISFYREIRIKESDDAPGGSVSTNSVRYSGPACR
jgi:hypothetical protein